MVNYKPSTLKKVLNLFGVDEVLGVTELSARSGLSRTILHKYVKALVKENELTKVGKGPKTKYTVTSSQGSKLLRKTIRSFSNIDYESKQLIDDIFLKFTPRGTELSGLDGLSVWCDNRNLDPIQKGEVYVSIYHHIQSLRNTCGLLDATKAFDTHVEEMALDKVFYADQYKWMDFGRGKLAELTFYAKQSQSRKLLRRSIDLFKDKLLCYIQGQDIDAIAFVPRSITRDIQLLKLIDIALFEIDLPRISIKKDYEGETKVPQKSLKKREDRIENARETIYIRDQDAGKYKTVLLIDDFVGSGSTLNETAKKLKKEGVKTVIGFAIVGNLDLSYEVINEV